MKKLLSLLLILIMCFSVVACTKTDEPKAKEPANVVGELALSATTEEELLENVKQEMADSGVDTKDAPSSVKFFDDLTSGLLSLDKGEISSITLPITVAEYISSQNEGKYAIKEPLVEVSLAFSMAVNGDERELLGLLNTAIDTLNANGTLDELDEIYLNGDEPTTAVEIPYVEGQPTYTVVVTGDLPPMDYTDAQNSPMGYNTALLSEMAKLMKCNFEVVSANSASRAIMLSSGKADIMFWVRGEIAPWTYGEISYGPDLPVGLMNTNVYSVQDLAVLELAK